MREQTPFFYRFVLAAWNLIFLAAVIAGVLIVAGGIFPYLYIVTGSIPVTSFGPLARFMSLWFSLALGGLPVTVDAQSAQIILTGMGSVFLSIFIVGGIISSLRRGSIHPFLINIK